MGTRWLALLWIGLAATAATAQIPVHGRVIAMDAIVGRVVGPGGDAMAAAEIFFDDEDAFPRTREPAAVSGDDGRFAIPDLRPGTRRDLKVVARGYAPLLLRRVEAGSGEVTAALAPGARLSGRVVDEDDRPVPVAELFVVAEDEEGTSFRPSFTVLASEVKPDGEGPDADGTDVAVPGAPVRVELPEWGSVAVRAPDLAEGEEATVQFVAADGRTYRDVDSGKARDAWELVAGRDTDVELPVGGTVRVTMPDGGVREREVTVAAGRQVRVE